MWYCTLIVNGWMLNWHILLSAKINALVSTPIPVIFIIWIFIFVAWPFCQVHQLDSFYFLFCFSAKLGWLLLLARVKDRQSLFQQCEQSREFFPLVCKTSGILTPLCSTLLINFLPPKVTRRQLLQLLFVTLWCYYPKEITLLELFRWSSGLK